MSAVSAPTDADVVIVGSGPSGAVVAKRMLEAGFRVVCLEQGDHVDYDLARSGSPEFELTAGRDWSSVPGIRNGPGDYPIDDSTSEIVPLMWNGVGGSSISWAANWMRTLPSDFRVRTLDGVADDWPISYWDLEPCFRRVERDFCVSGVDGDPAYPDSYDPPLPPVKLTKAGYKMAAAHNKLGWHWWPGSNAIATVPSGDMRPCQQKTACMWGCTEHAKVSTDRSHWPQLLRGGAQLITGARVLRLELNGRNLVDRVVYADREGAEHALTAPVVVLAANAIGTPRLLLNSASQGHPDGLANSSGAVGTRLMMHPTAGVVGLFDEDLESYRGVWGQVAYTLEFYETDASRDFVRGSKWSLQPTGGPLQSTKRWPWGDSTFWGANFHRELAERFGRSVSWGIICEDLPDSNNRVVLDSGKADGSGMPGVRIDYRTSENSHRMLRFMVDRAKESFDAAGAARTVVAPQVRETGWHILGTAKMGVDPADSVVDRYGKSFDVANLYIADGSVWPTSSGVNPTATIAAFALWLADHLVEERSNQAVSS